VVNYGLIEGAAGGAGGASDQGVKAASGAAGVGVDTGAGGVATITNAGTIIGAGDSVRLGSASDRLIADAGARFVGEIAGGGGTFELAGGSGHISGLGRGGTISGSDSAAFAGFAGFVIDAGGQWILSGANALNASQSLSVSGVVDVAGSLATASGATISIGAGGAMIFTGSGETLGGLLVNEGTLETKGANVVVDTLMHGSGGEVVINGGTLDFLSTLDQDVIFKGGAGTLELGQAQGAPLNVAGFQANGQQSLDLGGIGFIGAGEATFSGTAKSGVLTVSDGTHTALIDLTGDYLGDTFTAASDGHGGAVVTAMATTPSPHAFVAAMAAMGAGDAGPIHASLDTARGIAPFLAGPRLQTA
jgi:hypothetical protein